MPIYRVRRESIPLSEEDGPVEPAVPCTPPPRPNFAPPERRDEPIPPAVPATPPTMPRPNEK